MVRLDLSFNSKIIICCIFGIIFSSYGFNPRSFPSISNTKNKVLISSSGNKIPLKNFGYDLSLKKRENTLRMSLVQPTNLRGKEFGASKPQPLEQHPNLVTGKLENGLTYYILPNKVPAGRFEAHLEVLSGSANELESQQGMAHLLEHVAYMGSPKRQLISSTGSRTNAYTDFHHTVFYASCPVETQDSFWKKPLLPMAFDALIDVMTTKVNDERMEKERAAVLSEASMVNKMEYRVECQVLSALHSENRISKRFPIGKEDLIKSWTKEEVQLYHSLHYRPDNAILYVIGDVNIQETIKTINQKFGSLGPQIDHEKVFRESGEFPVISMQEVSPHYPPVIHRWSCEETVTKEFVPTALIKPVDIPTPIEILNGAIPMPRIYGHELLQAFSFHLFAKRPIQSITSVEALKRDIMRKISLSALQIRFNVVQRQDPLFTFIDFNQLNWPREGCAVCSLDLTCDPTSWRAAIVAAVKEIRRLGVFGLTEGEVARYKSAILLETEQYAAQGDQIGNEDVLNNLMESVSCGHTFMHPYQKLEVTQEILDSITLDDINQEARNLCEHLSHIQPDVSVKPAAIVACAPIFDRNGNPFSVTESDIAKAVAEGLMEPIEPIEETPVPKTLITPEELSDKMDQMNPKWVPLPKDIEATTKNNLGISQKMLSNGLRVNLMTMKGEPQKIAVRLYVPGGRLLESKNAPGSLVLGARTMQEGGAFSKMTREEVELFCIDHMVSVEILAKDDCLIFDFQSITSSPNDDGVSGFEGVMQVLHIILTDFKFEEDAFQRATQGCLENYDMITKGLDTACEDKIIQSLTKSDPRFSIPDPSSIQNLDLETVKNAVLGQLGPEAVEVSISGDLPLKYIENAALQYLGTVPTRPEKDRRKLTPASVNYTPLGRSNQQVVYFQDSEERALGYLAGSCPNSWGIFSDGTTLSEKIIARAGSGKEDKRRNHPLFGHVLLLVLQEIANRRLFSIVREERQLTYDASFQLKGIDSIHGGWYLVSVTSSPTQVQEALDACVDSLDSLKGGFGVMGDTLQSAKRTLVNRFRGEALTNKFWVEKLCGTQVDSVSKSLSCITEFENVLSGINVQDVQLLIEELNFCDNNLTSCVGITSSSPLSSLPLN